MEPQWVCWNRADYSSNRHSNQMATHSTYSFVLAFFSMNLRCSCWACQFNILYCFQSYLTDIDECSSNPCINRGVCVNEVNKYRCTCSPGFTGAQCEISKFNYFMLHLLHWLCCTMCKTNPTQIIIIQSTRWPTEALDRDMQIPLLIF